MNEEENLEAQNAESETPKGESLSADEAGIENIASQQRVEQPQTAINTSDISPSEIKNMEVHKHPHHVTHKKKWTEYLLEFFMLFLAVFLGFLAEYQLEHVIEHQREKEYMRSMIEDLKSDSTMLENNAEQRQSRIKMIDSLVVLISSSNLNEKGNDVYFFGRSISPPTNIFPNDRTIQQLKSSGNLRLIKNKDISNSIMAYDQKMRQTLFEMGDEVIIRSEYRQLARKVFKTTVFHRMLVGDSIASPSNNPQLYTTDAALINELIGEVQYLKRIHLAQLISSRQLLTQAKQLSDLIKKEYHLENE
ncbi:MAG: hypothetical protein WKF59_25580 [Chitinophagaceae bacterium]